MMPFPLAGRLRPAALLAAMLLPPALVAAAQAAQPAPASPAAGSSAPTDPQAPVPAASYQSPFSGYRSFGDTPPRPWKAANDEVARIGGWRAYTREAQQALNPPAPAAAASASPAGRGPHGKHQGHRP